MDSSLEARSITVHKITANISQSIIYEVKSARQVRYQPKNTDTKFRHLAVKHENDHVLGVGLKVHSSTRCKHLVTFLHSINVSVDYLIIAFGDTNSGGSHQADVTYKRNIYSSWFVQ